MYPLATWTLRKTTSSIIITYSFKLPWLLLLLLLSLLILLFLLICHQLLHPQPLPLSICSLSIFNSFIMKQRCIKLLLTHFILLFYLLWMPNFLWQYTPTIPAILSILLLPFLQLLISTFQARWSWSTCTLYLATPLLIHTVYRFVITLLITSLLLYSLNLLWSYFLSPIISYRWYRSIPLILLFLLSFPLSFLQSLNLFLHFPLQLHPFFLFIFITLNQCFLPLLHSSSILL